jgi:hypothetical protein
MPLLIDKCVMGEKFFCKKNFLPSHISRLREAYVLLKEKDGAGEIGNFPAPSFSFTPKTHFCYVLVINCIFVNTSL